MRHRKKGKQLSRARSHRRAMLRSLVSDLFRHGRVETTAAKAKEARPLAERLITLAKRGDLHARRQALRLLRNRETARLLFEEIAPRYQARAGGYTRIIRGARRRGDSAPISYLELVEARSREASKEPSAQEGVQASD